MARHFGWIMLAILAPAVVAAPLVQMTFEEPLAENGLPAKVVMFRDENGQYTTTIVDGGHESDKCLKMTGKGQWCGVVVGDHQPYDSKQRYHGEGWLQVRGEGRGTVKLDYFDGEHTYLGSSIVGYIDQSDKWRVVAVVSDPKAYPNAKFIAVAAALEGNGEMLVDDVFLERREPLTVESPDNLLPNGGVEYGVGVLPAHYFTTGNEGNAAKFEWTTDNPHSGRRCLRIHGPNQWAVIGHVNQEYNRAKTYTVSGWGRVVSGTAVLKVDFYADDKWLGDQVAEPFTGKQWQRLQFTVDNTKYPNAQRIGVSVVLQGDGDASFDDLMLTSK